MKVNREQVNLAVAEIGSALLRLQRSGLNETQVRSLVKNLVEAEDIAVSCEEGMWNEAEPAEDASAEAVHEGHDHDHEHDETCEEGCGGMHEAHDDDDAPDTVRSAEHPSMHPWAKGSGSVKDLESSSVPDVVRDTSMVKQGEDEDEENSPETKRSPKSEGFDKFMSDILLSEGKRSNAQRVVLPDSPGMQYAKRYTEKAHNRIVIKK